MKKPLSISYSIISVVFSIGIALLLQAQPAAALTLIPPATEVNLDSGTVYADTIKLFNETDHDVTLYTEITNFTASEDGSKPQYEFGLELTDLATWIQVEPGPIVLAPKERKDIPYTINPPENAEAGGHYAIIFFSDNPPQTSNDKGKIQIGSKLGSLILARVAGDVQESGNIESFLATDQRTVFNHLPVQFSLAFHNSGNVHLRPTGNIQIKNTFGQSVQTLELNAESSATLPDSTRTYKATWEKSVVHNTTDSWLKRFWEETKNEQANFAIGRYTATASLVAGQNNQITEQTTVVFWVLPWRIMSLYTLAGVILLLVLIRAIKGYNRWIIQRGQSK